MRIDDDDNDFDEDWDVVVDVVNDPEKNADATDDAAAAVSYRPESLRRKLHVDDDESLLLEHRRVS